MDNSEHKIHKTIRRLKCLFGFHQWQAHGTNVQGDTTLITLIWWECPHCGSSTLKCIFNND